MGGTGSLYVADGGNSIIRKMTSALSAGLDAMDSDHDCRVGRDCREQRWDRESRRGSTIPAAWPWTTGETSTSRTAQITRFAKSRPAVSAGQTNWVVTTIARLARDCRVRRWDWQRGAVHSPSGIAVDKAGNVYVADFSNSTIRKMRPSILGGQTQWLVTTIGGLAGNYGAADGTGSAARFDSPSGIVVNSAGASLWRIGTTTLSVMGFSPPYIVLDTPAIGNGHAQINFSLLSGMGASFSLLIASRPDGPWSTNAAAVLTTNVPGASYAFIAPLPQVAAQFYRVQLPLIWQLPLLIPNLTASAPSSGGLFLVRSSLSHEIISHHGLDQDWRVTPMRLHS